MTQRKRTKKNFIKIISMIIALVMLCANMTQLPIGASNLTTTGNSTATSRNLLNVFSAKMSSIQKENQTLSIERILPVKDFSGADYLVIECNPTGYMIYHPESGIFVGVRLLFGSTPLRNPSCISTANASLSVPCRKNTCAP